MPQSCMCMQCSYNCRLDPEGSTGRPGAQPHPSEVSNPQAIGHMRPRMAMNAVQYTIVNLLKIFFPSSVFMFVYLTCGPRQLFFFQCGPETPKGCIPLLR